jgi:hypothetical protein
MQDQQVQVLHPELAGRLVERVQCRVVAEVGDPDLRLQKDLVTGESGAADGLTDPAFVAIDGGGVDVTVADLQRGLDRGGGLSGGVCRRRNQGPGW